MTPLSPDQFRDALRKGLGRALLHVREFGCNGLENAILEACEHSLDLDPQSEGTRGEWLYEILMVADLGDFVRPQVLQVSRLIVPVFHRV